MPNNLYEKSQKYLKELCIDISERTTGKAGNRAATNLFGTRLESFNFETEMTEFDCLDCVQKRSELSYNGSDFAILPGPFTLSCNVKAELCVASSIDELRSLNAPGKILLLMGDLVKEQLMPKNFPFYNPDEHREIYNLLENSGAKAILSATSKNPELAGAIYPFPFIEDGDFNIPSAYMKDIEGLKLKELAGKEISLMLESERILQKGYNVIGRTGKRGNKKIIICAHIDSKPGTPGAIDNATGIVTLLLLAELLKDYSSPFQIEIVALNGEDYYSTPGNILYFNQSKNDISNIQLVINIDGAGYYKENSAYCCFNCTDYFYENVKNTFSRYKGISEGPQWIQSDHGMFVQIGVPAMAITSNNFMEKLSVEITHTKYDAPEIVDHNRIIEIANALQDLIGNMKV